jgi:hypothetical protein
MLAIVIPYYKITFFEETLKSLAIQTDKRFKVYIGDDASLESPKALLGKYKRQFDFEYYRFDENLGGTQLVRQWERCIGMVQDEPWLMVLGDDDVLGSHCVEAFYEALPEVIETNTKVVRFATEIIDDYSQVVSQTFKHPKLEKATDFFYRRFTSKTRISLSEHIFSKKVYNEIGFYNYNLAWFTDDRACLEFSGFDYIYSINKAIVSFRLSKKNISRHDYKLEEKEIVKLQFFKFLIYNHLKKFSKNQQRHLTLYYEQLIYKHNKISFSFWRIVILSFSTQLNFLQCIKFTRRVFIQLTKHDQ